VIIYALLLSMRSFQRLYGCLIISLLSSSFLWAQSFQLDTNLYVPAQVGLHNVSAIEYKSDKQQWLLVGDKGEQWQLANLTHPESATLGMNTGLRLEALRYHSPTKTYFATVEDDGQADRSYGFFKKDSLPRQGESDTITPFVKLIPLPFDNKGLEGLALGADSTVWIIPEAGWVPADTSRSAVAVYRYRWNGQALTAQTTFSYPPERMPRLKSTERYGGVSEILWSGKNTLLVLERFYDSDRDTSYAKLYEVTFSETQPELVPQKTLVFDVNKGLGGKRVDNLEGMAYVPDALGRQRIVIVSDDNGGVCPRPNGKRCQQTQFIILSRPKP
jgi:hypothetical protein